VAPSTREYEYWTTRDASELQGYFIQ